MCSRTCSASGYSYESGGASGGQVKRGSCPLSAGTKRRMPFITSVVRRKGEDMQTARDRRTANITPSIEEEFHKLLKTILKKTARLPSVSQRQIILKKLRHLSVKITPRRQNTSFRYPKFRLFILLRNVVRTLTRCNGLFATMRELPSLRAEIYFDRMRATETDCGQNCTGL